MKINNSIYNVIKIDNINQFEENYLKEQLLKIIDFDKNKYTCVYFDCDVKFPIIFLTKEIIDKKKEIIEEEQQRLKLFIQILTQLK